MERNPGAAAGSAIMGGASVAFWGMAQTGVALVSLPLLGVVALFGLGFYLHHKFLDPKALSFLKTCLWNRAFQEQRKTLQGAFVPCLMEFDELPLWKTWNEHVANALRDIYPPIVSCSYACGLLSVHVAACGFNPKVGLGIRLNYHGSNTNGNLNNFYSTNAEINETYLQSRPKDLLIGNVYNFDALYNVDKFIFEFSKKHSMDVAPHSVTVTVRYWYSGDMAAGTIEFQVSIHDNTINMNKLGDELSYPYVRTAIC